MGNEVIARYRRACEEFARVAGSVGARWDAPTPCDEWDARGVVEHVVGYHQVLVLSALGVEVERPKDDPAVRWDVTMDAVLAAIEREGALDAVVDFPGGGPVPLGTLLETLTSDVLVHTWDLGRAVGLDVTLDDDLCTRAYTRAAESEEMLRASDMFGPAVPMSEDAPVQDRLLGIMGRDPNWSSGG